VIATRTRIVIFFRSMVTTCRLPPDQGRYLRGRRANDPGQRWRTPGSLARGIPRIPLGVHKRTQPF
jgi:hypothetical protein